MATGYTCTRMPHDPDFEEGEYIAEAPIDLSPVSGAGYIISTASDYVFWLGALLNNTSPLTPDVIKGCFQPRLICSPTDVSNAIFDGDLLCALGWFIASYKGHRIV